MFLEAQLHATYLPGLQTLHQLQFIRWRLLQLTLRLAVQTRSALSTQP